MRILHTADWHMNNRLGRLDISSHIVDGLRQIADVLQHEAVDAMIVAGDLFSERSSREQLRAAIGQIRDIFGPFLARGGHIVAVSGNHDSELFFETLRDTLQLGVAAGEGRFHISASPALITVPDPQNNSCVQFALMPYPTARAFLHGENEVSYATLEEKNRLIQDNFALALQELSAQLDPTKPAVLVSHIHVRGANSHSLYRISESDDVIFEPSLLGQQWNYVAYGHIHKPGEAFAGATHARYCGSVARLDAAERDDQKSVVIVDIGPNGRHEPRLIPLRARDIHQIHIAGRDDLFGLAERIPNAPDALVHYTLNYEPGRDNLQAMLREVERAFPLWYERKIERVAPVNEEGAAIVASLSNARDATTTVRDYLKERFSDHADRDALMERAEELLAS